MQIRKNRDTNEIFRERRKGSQKRIVKVRSGHLEKETNTG